MWCKSVYLITVTDPQSISNAKLLTKKTGRKTTSTDQSLKSSSVYTLSSVLYTLSSVLYTLLCIRECIVLTISTNINLFREIFKIIDLYSDILSYLMFKTNCVQLHIRTT